MVSFDLCTYCTQTPRVQFCSTNSEENIKNQKAMTQQLDDLKIQVTVNDRYYRCSQCGTYYRFDSDFSGTIGYYDLRLVRITIFEALSVFKSDFKTEGDFDKAYSDAEDSRLSLEENICIMLQSPNSRAREFAAETLADLYKKQNKPEKLQELLQNPDAEIRLGALWSYAEIPRRSYNSEDPGLNISSGLFHYKPFIKLKSSKFVLELLCDPDKRIRNIARNFIKSIYSGKGVELAAKLHRIPCEKWTAELKYLLIENNYPYQDEKCFKELCNFLIDPDEETRRQALSRIYDIYSEKDIPVYINYIKEISKKNSTPQTEWFLEHPNAGFEKDDDDYFD